MTAGRETDLLCIDVLELIVKSIGRPATARLVAKLIATIEPAVERMIAAEANGDDATVRREAHQLQSAAGNLGLNRLSALCRHISDRGNGERGLVDRNLRTSLIEIADTAVRSIEQLRRYCPEAQVVPGRTRE